MNEAWEMRALMHWQVPTVVSYYTSTEFALGILSIFFLPLFFFINVCVMNTQPSKITLREMMWVTIQRTKFYVDGKFIWFQINACADYSMHRMCPFFNHRELFFICGVHSDLIVLFMTGLLLKKKLRRALNPVKMFFLQFKCTL